MKIIDLKISPSDPLYGFYYGLMYQIFTCCPSENDYDILSKMSIGWLKKRLEAIKLLSETFDESFKKLISLTLATSDDQLINQFIKAKLSLKESLIRIDALIKKLDKMNRGIVDEEEACDALFETLLAKYQKESVISKILEEPLSLKSNLSSDENKSVKSKVNQPDDVNSKSLESLVFPGPRNRLKTRMLKGNSSRSSIASKP